MPVYHIAPDILERAISSVHTQSYPFWQLCIVDDGTTEPAIRELLRAWAERDDRISLTRRERNGGIVAASNHALRMATGEFVALLDHDDELASEALYQVVVALNIHPDLDMLYSD